MPLPPELTIALKEWATVCHALESGRQILLLRKGGIYEAAGEFELEHREFLLFPTYLHQNLKMLKNAQHPGFEPATAEPASLRLSAAARVSDIVPITCRAAMDSLYNEHVWTTPLIDMRFNYKPHNPLYLMLLRVYRLHEHVVVANTPAYAGCKSWVPLEQPILTKDATAVLDETSFQSMRSSILSRLRAADK